MGKSWKCDICGKQAAEGIVGVGAFCSGRCRNRLVKKAMEHEKELLNEPLDQMPDEFDVAAFERFMMKLALHMIRDLPPKVRAKWTPLMLSASNLSLEIKGRVLKHVPLYYVSAVDAEGHAKMFYSATFMFKAKVPKRVILDALVKAKVFKGKQEPGDQEP